MATASLPTRIGRRLFGAFLIVAAVPVATVSIYALGHFTTVIEQQQQRQLGDALRAQGHLLLARMEEAVEALGQSQADDPPGAFLQIQRTPLADLRMTRPNLSVSSDELAIVLARGEQKIQGTLNPDWFWKHSVSLPPRVVMCAQSLGSGVVLFCGDQDGTNLDGQFLLEQLPGETRYAAKLKVGGVSYDVAQWELFLNSRMGSANWRLTGFRQSDDFLDALALKRFLPALVALSIAVAALFSLILLRRRLKPLQTLTEATSRVSQSNFSEPVEIEAANEFGDLGRSFNSMMERLHEETSRYRINAEIDRLILQSESVETVINLLLGRAFLFLDADYLTIAIFDQSDHQIATCQSTRRADGQVGEISQIKLSETDVAWISSAHRPSSFDPDWAPAESLQKLGGGGGLLVGIHWHSRPLGYLLVGIDDADSDTLDLRNQVIELRDRIGVTLTAAEKEKELFAQANFDTLTGLPNRHLLEDRLHLACNTENSADEAFALMFLDLDNFKLVNDSLGHTGGDQLIKSAASRLSACAQRGDTIARLGGDEFVIILQRCADPAAANAWAETAISALSQPVEINGQQTQVSASVGVAMFPQDGARPEELLRNADAAMYRSKDLGRNRVTFFTDDINRNINRTFNILGRLRRALANNELSLAYQPQLALASGAISGAEVLVRWPESNVSPGEMVQVAEKYGLIEELGEWVMNRACEEFSGLDPAIRPPRLSVNVSAVQLADKGFLGKVRACLKAHQLAPGELELELTESTLVEDPDAIFSQLASLRDAGLTVALDDFGTGFSSLTYLQRLPVDVIKIDRSFVTDVDTRASQQGFCTAVVQLAHTLGKKTVAEGAETETEKQCLQQLGCDLLQGYVFSRPIADINELGQFVKGHRLKQQATRPTLRQASDTALPMSS